MTAEIRCESTTRPTRRRLEHQCHNKARFKVVGNKRRDDDSNSIPWDGEHQCGAHVRAFLMDNGDSVWKPWIVTRLDDV